MLNLIVGALGGSSSAGSPSGGVSTGSVSGGSPFWLHWLHIAAVPKRKIMVKTARNIYNLFFLIIPPEKY